MELKGKKINVLGDSITEGCGTSGEDHTFWYLLGQRTGATVRGYGIGGTRITPQRERQLPFDDGDYVTRSLTMDPDADVVLVFGGTNDFGHGDAPLGTMADREPTSFYGAMHTLCRQLIERYPAATVVFLTPLHRLSEYVPVNERGIRTAAPLATYVDIIREVAEYYSLPVCDLWRISGLQPAVPVIQETYMPDGLHPNDAGHERLEAVVEGFLRAL